MMKLISEQSAARKLAISIRKLQKLVRAGEIPHVELPGGMIRFDEQKLEEWIATRQIETTRPVLV